MAGMLAAPSGTAATVAGALSRISHPPPKARYSPTSACAIDPSAWADLPQVRWVGKVPRSEVGRYYEAADLFILPTISDGYALTQLEALAHGLPVLASRHCGDAVRHGENGWILEDLEPETIARTIRQARESLPLTKVEMPAFGMEALARALAR